MLLVCGCTAAEAGPLTGEDRSRQDGRKRMTRRRNGIGRSGRSNDYCLVFMHIPKTAGTTISSTLRLNYPQDLTLSMDLFDKLSELESVPLEKRSQLRLLYGHLPWGVHEYIPRSCQHVTVLREPVSRVVSDYKYVLKTLHHPLHDRVVDGKIGLEEFIETLWLDKRISRQTRQLSNRASGPLDRDALEQAKRNLSEFLVVGLTERFEETFVLLRRALRLRLPFYATRNVSAPLEVSERAVELIREREELDLELYDFARTLFAEQIAGQNRSFNMEVSLFRALRPVSRMAGGGGRTEEILRKLSHHARAAKSPTR